MEEEGKTQCDEDSDIDDDRFLLLTFSETVNYEIIIKSKILPFLKQRAEKTTTLTRVNEERNNKKLE
jgi:hypothetical protein